MDRGSEGGLAHWRDSSLEHRSLPLCCTLATDGNRKKERGIFSQQHTQERSINNGYTNMVDPSMPWDPEHHEWMLC